METCVTVIRPMLNVDLQNKDTLHNGRISGKSKMYVSMIKQYLLGGSLKQF